VSVRARALIAPIVFRIGCPIARKCFPNPVLGMGGTAEWPLPQAPSSDAGVWSWFFREFHLACIGEAGV
jgi:hypothetical protein